MLLLLHRLETPCHVLVSSHAACKPLLILQVTDRQQVEKERWFMHCFYVLPQQHKNQVMSHDCCMWHALHQLQMADTSLVSVGDSCACRWDVTCNDGISSSSLQLRPAMLAHVRGCRCGMSMSHHPGPCSTRTESPQELCHPCRICRTSCTA